LVIDQVHNANTPEEDEEELFYEMQRHSNDDGRSAVCGY